MPEASCCTSPLYPFSLFPLCLHPIQWLILYSPLCWLNATELQRWLTLSGDNTFEASHGSAACFVTHPVLFVFLHTVHLFTSLSPFLLAVLVLSCSVIYHYQVLVSPHLDSQHSTERVRYQIMPFRGCLNPKMPTSLPRCPVPSMMLFSCFHSDDK